MADGKREIAKCDRCKGEGQIPVSPFSMIARHKFVECPKCLGDKVIRAPLPPPPTPTQDLG